MSTRSTSAPPPARSGLRATWSRLDHRQRRIGAAALLVLVTMVLPWYSEETATRRGPGELVRSGGSVSGLAGMSFVEASLLVVLIGIVALLWGRGSGRRFALPYPDGTLICAAAGWMGALIVYRLFSRPHGDDSAQAITVIGLNWGIFVSLLAVGVLFAAALDLRRHGPRSVMPGEPAPAPPSDYPDVDPATIVVRPRPHPDEQPTTRTPTWADEQPTTRIPTWDDQPTERRPAARPPADEQPTERRPAVPAPADEQPPRRSPAFRGSADQPPAGVPSSRSGRRTPSPPTRPNDGPAGPDRDTWPSRMRRTPRTPTPREPNVDDRDSTPDDPR